jgi:hypothetical protein
MPDFLLMPARTLRRTMKELLEAIAKALVDNPHQVQVRAIEAENVTVLELRVHPGRWGSNQRPPHGILPPPICRGWNAASEDLGIAEATHYAGPSKCHKTVSSRTQLLGDLSEKMR